MEDICDAEICFNCSLPALRTSVCVPLVALVRSSRTTALIARCILAMLDCHLDKMVDMFDAHLFPRLTDGEEVV